MVLFHDSVEGALWLDGWLMFDQTKWTFVVGFHTKIRKPKFLGNLSTFGRTVAVCISLMASTSVLVTLRTAFL